MFLLKEEIVSQLKTAREAAGLSQRDLSALTGIPQGQLSRIENGRVEPRLGSLLTLSRALGLELVLVPRSSLTAVYSVMGIKESSSRPAYTLEELDND